MNGDHGPATRRIWIRYENNIHGFGVERTFRELKNRINEAFGISTYEVKYNDLNRKILVSVRTEQDYQNACALLQQQPDMPWEVTGQQPPLFQYATAVGVATGFTAFIGVILMALFTGRC